MGYFAFVGSSFRVVAALFSCGLRPSLICRCTLRNWAVLVVTDVVLSLGIGKQALTVAVLRYAGSPDQGSTLACLMMGSSPVGSIVCCGVLRVLHRGCRLRQPDPDLI